MNLPEEDLRRILTTATYLSAFSRNAGKLNEVGRFLRNISHDCKLDEAIRHIDAAHDLIFRYATEYRDNFCVRNSDDQATE